MIGFHSTIDRPDSVRRVAPPTIRVRKIIAAATNSQRRTARSWISDAFAGSVIVVCLRGWRGPYSHGLAFAIEGRRGPMSIRARKFVGTIALIVLVAVWALLAMALAQSVLTDINGFVAALYYITAGLGWVLPAMPLISWMARPDKAETP